MNNYSNNYETMANLFIAYFMKDLYIYICVCDYHLSCSPSKYIIPLSERNYVLPTFINRNRGAHTHRYLWTTHLHFQ